MNKTIIAIGIIALFIGVGIQPAISNEVSIPTISDSEKDCIECKSTDRPICVLLQNRIDHFAQLYVYYTELSESYPEGSYYRRVYELTAEMMIPISWQFYLIGVFFKCWEPYNF
jgi:hypothetical protein